MSMDMNPQETYQMLVHKLSNGIKLSEDERKWISSHPIESSTYKQPWIIGDIISLGLDATYAVTIKCNLFKQEHPIVPTLSIPFGKEGYIQLAGIAGLERDVKTEKKSIKLSFRMIGGITAIAKCVSESGLLMVSYQGWVPDAKPFPLWYESINCERFAMKKTVLSDNLVQYDCRGADGSENAFSFTVNWYPV